ncbi:MAG: nitrogenase component 1 [Clostridiales bacterium]|nr:nitrogenase component 1 [Clostridiales bacterium]
MKGLRLYLPPFAPDSSGASSVLYELGGILVICDAGGCTGNVCGFDEPRWFTRKSAVFSAGLRDMDAILGRDDLLADKLASAAKKLDASFAGIIGTPVPSVIGTDYHALKRMVEKRCGLPVVAVDTTGIDLYDVGEEKAFLALFRTFTEERTEERTAERKGCVGILGATPLEVSDLDIQDRFEKILKKDGVRQVFCYGMGAGLEEIQQASNVEYNLVVSPAGLKSARYLEKTYGTPYRVGFPGAARLIPQVDFSGKRVLIIHQQVLANSLREEAEKAGASSVTVGSFFMMKREWMRPGDVSLTEEDDLKQLVKEGSFDLVLADEILEPLMDPDLPEFVDLVHFACSGRLGEWQ